ncbi:hypothetical protein OSB04_011322 [Centaurea solstitialis]|uniref:Uncharacterized protein n=1 Tax=Centaurea solstitialis TaxID=347529 RepID=A0AA38T973_9ASTR|nr:hypothetical protein OSB04_011322 [Centaurea solstitialis]
MRVFGSLPFTRNSPKSKQGRCGLLVSYNIGYGNPVTVSHIILTASQKEITNEYIKRWLNRLQHLAYDIDDILDVLATEATYREMNQGLATVTSKVRTFIPTCSTSFSVGFSLSLLPSKPAATNRKARTGVFDCGVIQGGLATVLRDVSVALFKLDPALGIVFVIRCAPIVPTVPNSEPIEEVQTQDLRRSSRVRQEPDRYLGFLVSQDSGDLNEPASYGEAVSGNESEQWQEAMKAEMQSMYDNQVWELTDLPQHCRAVGRKWVFKKKTDMDGNIHTFKTRLVAKGFTQTHGIDYDETFSPVAMLKSIRIQMAISAYFNYEIWQMDVKTAFLNGKLTEDVHMEQPEGFEDPKNPNKVCKLLKSIYGLKQASRSWNLHFDERIKEFGFAKSEFEPCVYTKFSGSIVTFLVLYVDDILLIGNDVPTLKSVKNWLSRCFQMKDLGEAAYILGIKIYRNRSKRLIGLSQSTYIDKILKKFRMDESKKGFIPMQHGIVLSKTQCPVSSQDQDKMKSVPYASAIGSIMYAMLCTRPDVAYSVSVTSRYQQNPGEPHWVAVKNILKYLRRTKDMFLVFGGSEDEISVTGYSDASFQTDRDDFRSQSGYVFTLNRGAISWKSSKQDTIADSTTEVEYIAASDAAKEAVWLRNFLSDLRVVASVSRPIDIFCDNSGAVAQAKEPREHHKSRHVLRKYHLIREIIGRGDVRICKIPTEENVADPLTKPLARVKHEAHANSIGMQYLDACLSWIRLWESFLLSAAHRLCLRFPTITTKLQDLEKEKVSLLLTVIDGKPINLNRKYETSLPDACGKTTIARLLYNDTQVKDHFKIRAWVCVSGEFDIMKISKSIFEYVTGENKDFADINLLQEALKEHFMEKQFLLVLDDVWSENDEDWDTLVRPFHVGARGSIVKKCDGLPLALRALGGLLRTKTEEEEWKELLNNEIWKLQKGDGVVPALRLSYHDLPACLKQLFAYCSLFPKDYMFDKEELILLWMAEGFLHQSTTSTSTTECLGHEYFEELLSRSFFQRTPMEESLFVMHDLMNDLATSVARDFFFETLIVYGCHMLSKLPSNFSKLKNLRHFDIRDTPLLNKLPFGISELRSLQTLSKNIIEGDNGFALNELKNLKNLHGKISIKGLDKVPNVMHAQEANLSQKRLSELEVEWGDVFSGSQNEALEKEVLNELKPHNGIFKRLKIVSYGGIEFPNWVGDPSFLRLTHVSIRGCKKCTSIPPLGQLPSLKELFIQGMDGLKVVGSELLGTGAFALLEILSFEDMQGWEVWSTDSRVIEVVFPCLKELCIYNCPSLVEVSLEALPSLRVLKVKRSGHGILKSLVHVASLVINLEMGSIAGLTNELWRGVIEYLGTVEEVRIERCDEIKYLWESQVEACKVLVNLRRLEVDHCENLLSLGEKEEDNCGNNLTSLRTLKVLFCKNMKRCCCPYSIETLTIYNCSSITFVSIPTRGQKLKSLIISECGKLLEKEFGGGVAENTWVFTNSSVPLLEVVCIGNWSNLKSINDLQFFVHLTQLKIVNCPCLESFPDRELLNLTSLKRMSIQNCPSMDASFPRGFWPPKLCYLTIGKLKKPISKWGPQNFPRSLVALYVVGGLLEDDVSSFSQLSQVLPSSLTLLFIGYFNKLESLSMGLEHLTSLQSLHIYQCPKMKDLPETLFVSLLRLVIFQCPYLEERCSRKGSYRHLTSHIPEIQIYSGDTKDMEWCEPLEGFILLVLDIREAISKMAENFPLPHTHSTSNLTLLSILSKDKLTRPNYLDWIRALRIALRYEDKEYLLDEELPILDDRASPEVVAEYDKHGMLRSAEASMGKTQSAHSTTPILAIREGGCKKKKVSHPKGKGKAKVVLHNQGLKRKAETS